jgi:hypothetical protein
MQTLKTWKLGHRRLIVSPFDDTLILRRWTLVETPLFGVKIHHLLESDPPERGFHDHPWNFVSLRLRDLYIENVLLPSGVVRRERKRFTYRNSTTPHRIDVPPGARCWTFVITGPRRRDWGFISRKTDDDEGMLR